MRVRFFSKKAKPKMTKQVRDELNRIELRLIKLRDDTSNRFNAVAGELREAKERPKPIIIKERIEEFLLTEFDPELEEAKSVLLTPRQHGLEIPALPRIISERGIIARAKISPRKDIAEFTTGDDEIVVVRGAKIYRAKGCGYCNIISDGKVWIHFYVDGKGIVVFSRQLFFRPNYHFQLRSEGKFCADIGLIGAKSTPRGRVVVG